MTHVGRTVAPLLQTATSRGETHGTVDPPVLPLYLDADAVFAGRPKRRVIGEMYGGRYAYDPEVFDDHDRSRACEETERASWMNEAGEEMPVGAAVRPFEEDLAEGEYGKAGRYDENGELRRDYAEGMGVEGSKGGEVAAAAAPLESDGGGDGRRRAPQYSRSPAACTAQHQRAWG